MRKILFLIAAAAGTASAATSAMACEPPVIKIGAEGRPEYISPDRDLTADMEALFGPAPGKGSVLVIDVRSREGRWLPPDSTLTSQEIALLFGADTNNGFLYSGPDHCAPPDLPLDPELPKAPQKLPEELFPDEVVSGPQPQDGLWQARLGETRLEGCPPMMAQAFPKSPGALPAEWLAPRRLAFKTPFHPDQLDLSRTLAGAGMGKVTWQPAGEGTWRAEIMQEVLGQIPGGQMPGGKGNGSGMTWTLSVKGPDRIDHTVAVNFVFPPEAAQVLGSKGCKMTTANQWLRVGDAQ